MSLVTRRNFIKTTAAGLALPALGSRAFAAEPLKVGFVYLGAIGDWGWTWSHEKGRKELVDASKAKWSPTMSRTSRKTRVRSRS